MHLAVGAPQEVQHLVDGGDVDAPPGTLQRAGGGILEGLLVADAAVEVSDCGCAQNALGDAVEVRPSSVAGTAEATERDVVLLLDALFAQQRLTGSRLLLLPVVATLLGSRLGVGFISQLRFSFTKNDKATCFVSGNPIYKLYNKKLI